MLSVCYGAYADPDGVFAFCTSCLSDPLIFVKLMDGVSVVRFFDLLDKDRRE